jgi:hypothetical protein
MSESLQKLLIPARISMEVVAEALAEISLETLEANGVVALPWFLQRYHYHLVRLLEARGHRQYEIALLLGVGDRTVRNYRKPGTTGPPAFDPYAISLLDSLLAAPERTAPISSLTDSVEKVNQTLPPALARSVSTDVVLRATLDRLRHSGLIESLDDDRVRLGSDQETISDILATLCVLRIHLRPGISGAALADELGVDFETTLRPVLQVLRDEGRIRTNGRGFSRLDIEHYVIQAGHPRYLRFGIAEILQRVGGAIRARMRFAPPPAPPSTTDDDNAPPPASQRPGFSTFVVDIEPERLEHPAFQQLARLAWQTVQDASALRRTLPPVQIADASIGRARKRLILFFGQYVSETPSAAALDDTDEA